MFVGTTLIAYTYNIQDLCEAAGEGRIELIDKIIKSGVSFDSQMKEGETPLMCGCATGKIEVVKYLVNKGANIDKTDKIGKTPLFFSVQRNTSENVVVTKYLIEKKANVNTKLKTNGATPLIKASYTGNIEAVKLLLLAGANINDKDNNGKTALKWAKEYKQNEIEKLLTKTGAKE